MLPAHCAASARARSPHTAHPAPRTAHAAPRPCTSHMPPPLPPPSPHTTAAPTQPLPAHPLKAGCPRLVSTCHPQRPRSPARPAHTRPRFLSPGTTPARPFSAAPEARRVLQALLEVHGHLHGGGARRCLRCCGCWRWWRGEPGARRDRARAGGRGGTGRGGGGARGRGGGRSALCPPRPGATDVPGSQQRPPARAGDAPANHNARGEGSVGRAPNKRGRSEDAANRRHRSDCSLPRELRVTAGAANGQAAVPNGGSMAATARIAAVTARPGVRCRDAAWGGPGRAMWRRALLSRLSVPAW